jgi:hypothetical protein
LARQSLVIFVGALLLGCDRGDDGASKTAPLPDEVAASVSAVPAASAAPSGGASAAPAGSAIPFALDRCTAKCQAMATELGCEHADKCAESCEKLSAAVNCRGPIASFLECFLDEPKDHWECDHKGIPTLGHVCEAEQNNVYDCGLRNGGTL